MSFIDKLSGLIGNHDDDVPEEPPGPNETPYTPPPEPVTVQDDIEAEPYHHNPGLDVVRQLDKESK